MPLGGSLKGYHVSTAEDRVRVSDKCTTYLPTPRLINPRQIDQRLLVLEAECVSQASNLCLDVAIDLRLKHTFEDRLAVLDNRKPIKKLDLRVLLNQQFD